MRAARLELDYRRTQRTWQEKEVERLKGLWRQQMISNAELEEAKNILALQQIQESRGRAQVQAVESGSKEEELDWRRSRILVLQEELNILGERLEKSVIHTPIGGRVATLAAGDTIAVVHDTTAYIALVPIRWRERVRVVPQQRVEVPIEGANRTVSGRIIQLGKTVHTVGSQQFFATKVIIEEGGEVLAPGLVVRCSIIEKPVSPWELVRRLL